MKSTLFACISVFVLVFTKVDGSPVDNDKGDLSGNFSSGTLEALQNEFIKYGLNFTESNNTANNKSILPQNMMALAKIMLRPSSNSIFGTLNTVLSGIGSVYHEILTRHQAFINLLTCGNCVSDGWNSILEVATRVPELNWIQQPNNTEGGDFFTAFHLNGQVVGIGGVIINNKPLPQYTFNKEGIVQQISELKKYKDESTQH